MPPSRPVSRRITLPIPAMPDRPELVAALTFLEDVAARRMDREGLIVWLEHHLVEPGRMPRPSAVYEPGAGVVVLRGRSAEDDDLVPDVVAATRARTLDALRGLLTPPIRDGFVTAALFAGRVRRSGDTCGWLTCPRPSDALSDVLLALLTVDVLRFREDYEERLRVCGLCGRVALDATTRWGRGTCARHAIG